MARPKIDLKTAQMWSKIGPRATFGQSILHVFEGREDLVAMSADLGSSSGLERLKKASPDKFIDVGIAEQNLIGMASGIAKEGFCVFASSFAPFVTMRACEQLRMNLGYMKMNVKAVGIGSGLAMGFLGNSHFGLEDVSIVRSIPDIDIVSPADCVEIYKAVETISTNTRPTYLRLTGAPNMPIVYEHDYEFKLGKFIQFKSGFDVTIIATGSMVAAALEAAEQIEKQKISVGVVNCHTIRPLDIDSLSQILQNCGALVTVEEHFASGGLGSQILEFMNLNSYPQPMLRIGLDQIFDLTGDYEFLLKHHNLTSNDIASAVLKFLSKSR
jgi:transketolase